ncbi:MAG: F0F1 ATP synthase subunit epsilon [Sulfuricella sp.]|nr:F0F1 ATP synthase subunit epsilon [Sulfuricella sp.]
MTAQPTESLTLKLNVVSVEAEIYSGEATRISVPAALGEIGILPRHTPLITRLRAGEVRVHGSDGRQVLIYVSGGMLEIQPQVVTILADTATRASSTDKAAADEARRRTEEALSKLERFGDRDRAHAELMASIAELSELQRLHKKKRRW